MDPIFQIIGIVVSIALGLAATIIGSLVLSRLAAIDKRIDAHDTKIDELMGRKEICQNEFVSVEQFLRETGYARQQLDRVVASLSELSAKMEIASQLPQICGQIVSNTVKELVPLVSKGKGYE